MNSKPLEIVQRSQKIESEIEGYKRELKSLEHRETYTPFDPREIDLENYDYDRYGLKMVYILENFYLEFIDPPYAPHPDNSIFNDIAREIYGPAFEEFKTVVNEWSKNGHRDSRTAFELLLPVYIALRKMGYSRKELGASSSMKKGIT